MPPEFEFDQSEHITHTLAPPIEDHAGATGVVNRIRTRLRSAVRGRDDVIELIIVAVLADGHVLLEDYPGSGKTTLAKALGDCIIDDMPDDDIVTIRRIPKRITSLAFSRLELPATRAIAPNQ